MQVILLDRIAKLGKLGEVVRVRDGYARNFLIPKGLAKRATQKAIADFERQKVELEQKASDKLNYYIENVDRHPKILYCLALVLYKQNKSYIF